MEGKKSLRDTIVKHWFGISGTFDEYKRQEVNRIGTNAFMLLLPFSFISLFVAGLTVVNRPQDAISVIIILQVGYFMFVIFPYIIFASHRAHITDTEVTTHNLKQAYLHIGQKMGFGAVYTGLWFYFQTILLDHYFDGTNLLHSLTQWHYIWAGIWTGGIMGIIIGIQALIRLKKYR